MNRSEMINHIIANFDSWADFYSLIKPTFRANGASTYEGWYVCYEGWHTTDMYLQTEHPCSDITGDVITAKDCNFKETLK